MAHLRYACTTIRVNGVKRRLSMHRMLLDAEDGMDVDHIDGDGLNNSRGGNRVNNLRLVTTAMNCQNMVRRNRPPNMRNVYWSKRYSVWLVQIRATHIGTFRDVQVARVAARDARARLLPFANEERHK
jgi:hypothetical protein